MSWYDDHLEEVVAGLVDAPDRKPPKRLSKKDLAHWRRLRDSIREILDRGDGVEMPHDIPAL